MPQPPRKEIGLAWMAQDLREGIRRLKRHPRFTLLATATLALGLATSTAVFSYLNAYARPFPGVAVDELHQVWFATEDEPWGALSYPDFLDLLELDGQVFSVTGFGRGPFAATVRRDQATEVAFGQSVARGFFSALGIEMSAGRGFSPADDLPGATPTVVLSHEYWVRRYGADPDVVGQTILLNNEPYVIVGVAGPKFLGVSAAARPQFWLPFEQFLRVYRARSDTRENRETGSVLPIVRLLDGVSVARASDALQALARSLDSHAPLAERTRRFVLEPATWISPETREAEASTSRIMMGVAGFLLLLACANVANLVLAAGARRLPEMAVRGAMGASPRRLVGQLLTESLLLSTLAGAAALVLAGPIGNRLSSYFARPSVWGANVARDIVVDPHVMLFAFAAAVVTGVATGLIPALRSSAREPAEILGARSPRSSAGRKARTRLPGTRDLLVSSQIAICVVLLFVAGLMLRTLQTTREVDPGFNARQTLASYVSTSSMGVPVSERHRFFEELIRRLDALPWVVAATVAENAPLSGHPRQALRPQDEAEPVETTVARVWTGYFEVMEMDILRGRSFLLTDTEDAKGVVVVNESLATRLVADGDAVGRTLWWPGEDDQPDRGFLVVGVVRDARQETLLDDPGPVAYFSLPQSYSRPGNALLVKVRGDPAAAVRLLERELHALDTRLAIVNILPYRDVVRGFLYTQRMNAELFTVVAAIGLLLAATGVFAVVALAVAGRRHEIGIRMAVGADRIAIAKSVLGSIGGSVTVGLGAGLAGAFGATRLVGSLLWGVEPSDPLALAVGLGVLLTALVLAVGVPLRRALQIDPIAALRTE
jgi:putative ABC transport system permease protein